MKKELIKSKFLNLWKIKIKKKGVVIPKKFEQLGEINYTLILWR